MNPKIINLIIIGLAFIIVGGCVEQKTSEPITPKNEQPLETVTASSHSIIEIENQTSEKFIAKIDFSALFYESLKVSPDGKRVGHEFENKG